MVENSGSVVVRVSLLNLIFLLWFVIGNIKAHWSFGLTI